MPTRTSKRTIRLGDDQNEGNSTHYIAVWLDTETVGLTVEQLDSVFLGIENEFTRNKIDEIRKSEKNLLVY